ncbi:glycosyltransferase [Halorubrum sp. SD690R]|uniref:glycosyltransferase n=1 Tax=Halorubrum sp. SD690R TaxID=2518117 RepID=UPI0013050A13|nr:glycosyltransferase [Halorubrum sp. SD690R]
MSIILPTYEPKTEHIGQSIQSIADQTYDDIELVIVDSTGLDWLRELGEEYSWVTYQYQEPAGLPAAWNAGIDAATGEFIGFLSDDDYYAEEKVEIQVTHLNQGYDLVYADEYVIDEDGSVTYLSALPVDDPEHHYVKYFREGHGVPHLTVFGRADCFRSEPFDERLEVREDPHLWVRLFKRYDVSKIDKALAYKRRREDSATGDPEMLYDNELREIDLLCEEFPELEEYRSEREQMAKYRYGKHLLRIGRTSRSRSVFLDLLRDGMVETPVIGLLLVSLLPAGNRTAFQYLESLAETRKQ